MSDDLTHDKVVVLSPEIKMGYVNRIGDGCAAHYKG